jgi:hypothetical protein
MQPGKGWPVFASLVVGSLLFAADQPWKTKPVSNWTRQDAVQILHDSPWSHTTIAEIARMQTEFERRDGGNMGQEKGVGFDGVDQQTKKQQAAAFWGRAVNGSPNVARPFRLQVVWESALPIRAAELKTGLVEPPTLSSEGYSIAVYGIPGSPLNEDPAKLGEPLKKQAYLRREGKGDVRPSRVEVFLRSDGLVAVYLFPLSAELTKKDGLIEFSARIGRVGVAQYFDAAEMVFQDKLQ